MAVKCHCVQCALARGPAGYELRSTHRRLEGTSPHAPPEAHMIMLDCMGLAWDRVDRVHLMAMQHSRCMNATRAGCTCVCMCAGANVLTPPTPSRQHKGNLSSDNCCLHILTHHPAGHNLVSPTSLTTQQHLAALKSSWILEGLPTSAFHAPARSSPLTTRPGHHHSTPPPALAAI